MIRAIKRASSSVQKSSCSIQNLDGFLNLKYSQPENTIAIGDNIVFLRDLKSNFAQFDVIYIDPPYNTGNKFSYNDKRTADDWISFMSERLKFAKTILNNDGVIFISIDDSSLYELKITCDDIFGKNNFLGIFITKQAVRSNSTHINTIHEYVVSYAKDKKQLKKFQIKRLNNPNDAPMIKDISNKVKKEFQFSGKKSAEKLLAKLNADYMDKKGITWLNNYSTVDKKGEIFFPKDLSVPGTPAELVIEEINLKLPALRTRKWSSPKKIIKLHNENKLHFKGNRPYEIHYLKDACDNVSSILDFYSRHGTNDLNKLGLRNLFDTPKPVELIKHLIRISTNRKDNARILDFFAGSGTTGQAVMEINCEDGKNHYFYLSQLDEKISKDTEQYKFAINNKIEPTVDQLMIHRLNVVKNKLHFDKDFKIIRVGEL
ncbi:MAG: site-specific DNA-methyltransferase [Candidatus Ancillula sp.]|jgi:adenine-specific DNA-methyltransferase|nr:site-specific DNA-methyltransferase [Candidatus Ancillula sp.]